MQQAGIEAFSNRTKEKSEIYSFENGTKKFSDSQISNMLLKRIHSVTVDGFLMKVILFRFVFTINKKFL